MGIDVLAEADFAPARVLPIPELRRRMSRRRVAWKVGCRWAQTASTPFETTGRPILQHGISPHRGLQPRPPQAEACGEEARDDLGGSCAGDAEDARVHFHP